MERDTARRILENERHNKREKLSSMQKREPLKQHYNYYKKLMIKTEAWKEIQLKINIQKKNGGSRNGKAYVDRKGQTRKRVSKIQL